MTEPYSHAQHELICKAEIWIVETIKSFTINTDHDAFILVNLQSTLMKIKEYQTTEFNEWSKKNS